MGSVVAEFIDLQKISSLWLVFWLRRKTLKTYKI